MEIDDHFSLSEATLQAGVLAAQPTVLLRELDVAGLRCAAPGRFLAPPVDQMRRVEAFATKQSADLPRLRAAGGLLDDATFVVVAEPAAQWALQHLRVGP